MDTLVFLPILPAKMLQAASGTSLQVLNLKEPEVKDIKKVSSLFSGVLVTLNVTQKGKLKLPMGKSQSPKISWFL